MPQVRDTLTKEAAGCESLNLPTTAHHPHAHHFRHLTIVLPNPQSPLKSPNTTSPLEKPLLTYSLGSFYCLQAAASAFAAAAAAPKMLQHNSQHVEQFSHEAESSGRRAPFPKTCARASDRIQF